MSEAIPPLPAAPSGTEVTRFNALKHGLLSRYTVLPWEEPDEYQALLAMLVAEHAPAGPTEEHLVEELAGIFWRKRRLRLAEAAAHRRGLKNAMASYRHTAEVALVHVHAGDDPDSLADAVRATSAEAAAEIAEIEEDERMTREALDLLRSSRKDAYKVALSVLRHDTRQWWDDMLNREPDELDEDEEPATPDATGLRHFLEGEVLPSFERQRAELAHRPLLREQAFGESLDISELAHLVRYETHLDRKLERMLAMLLKLKELRQGTIRS